MCNSVWRWCAESAVRGAITPRSCLGDRGWDIAEVQHCNSPPCNSSMAARARSARLGRSKWLLEILRTPTFPTSNPLGSAGGLEMVARGRGVPPRRSKWPLELPRLRWGARHGRSSPLGSAGTLDMTAQARSAPPGRSTGQIMQNCFQSCYGIP